MIYMYHVTTAEAANKILKGGLRINQEPNLTLGGIWAHLYYGKARGTKSLSPIFLSSKRDARFQNYINEIDSPVILKVDVTNLDLAADLPALIDFGATLTSDDTLYWEEGEEPRQLQEFLEEGEIPIEQLLSGGPAEASIRLTGSAACLQDIPTSRITTVRHNPSPSRQSLDAEIRRLQRLLKQGTYTNSDVQQLTSLLLRSGQTCKISDYYCTGYGDKNYCPDCNSLFCNYHGQFIAPCYLCSAPQAAACCSEGGGCTSCLAPICGDHSSRCSSCDALMCEHHIGTCRSCECSYCSRTSGGAGCGILTSCAHCNRNLCGNCSIECDLCEHDICPGGCWSCPYPNL